ncbi:hypothetical protein ACS0TY_026929 [Phlomoides rotata]
MFKKFKEIGMVRDVFIPDRKDMRGSSFGFVRFGGNIDKASVEQKLNSIWIESYKIRANISKFVWKDDNPSYAEVVKGGITMFERSKIPEKRENECNNFGLRYKADEEDLERLSKCYTGQLKEKYMWMDIGNDVMEACERKLELNYMGGRFGSFSTP